LLACLLSDYEGQKEVIALADFSVWLQAIFRYACITTCTAEHWRWWSRQPDNHSRGNASSL